MEFGLTGDRDLLPDLGDLTGFLAKAFVELEGAVGIDAQSPGD
jgi:hypothetical protein